MVSREEESKDTLIFILMNGKSSSILSVVKSLNLRRGNFFMGKGKIMAKPAPDLIDEANWYLSLRQG
jgi:hypothetical protein